MNFLLAKTKGRHGEFFKVISGEDFFELPEDLDNGIDYEPDHKLDEDSWFAIEAFSEKEYCIDFVTKRFIPADYAQIAAVDYANIDYLCAHQSGVYYFQNVTPKQLIRRKYLTFSDEPEFYENSSIIIMDSFADAIYVKEDDTLYFKKLSTISSIFKGIYELYKEATDEETEAFLEQEFINLHEDYSAEMVKRANRKRIAMAMETLKKFKPKEKKQIFSYIREYCEDLEFDESDENFAISNEEDLKKLLYGIEQRYYTTRIGKEKRLANSITRV